MAQIYNTLADGNAQGGLKTGDYVKTNGGLYQILDGNKYSGMTSDQLSKAGVSYNPATGYYSKKSNDISDSGAASIANATGLAKYQDSSTLNDWKNAYINQQVANLRSAYNSNLSNLTKTYNKNYADQYNQINSLKNDYRDNLKSLYDSTYLNNAAALQQAENRGMTSSAQGLAMGTSGLMSASQQASQLASDRDDAISNIQTKLNELTANYGADTNDLTRTFSSDRINAMSTAELQRLQSMLDIDKNNAATYNSYLSQDLDNQFNSSEAQKERDDNYKNSLALQQDQENWQTGENALDRSAELAKAKYSSYGGYGGYSGYGRYSGYGGYKNYSSSKKKSSDSLIKMNDNQLEYVGQLLSAGKLSDTSMSSIIDWANNHPKASQQDTQKWVASNLLKDSGKHSQKNTPNSNTSSNSSSKTTNHTTTSNQKSILARLFG